MNPRNRALALALSGVAALLFLLPGAAQAAAPVWKLTVTPNADYVLSGPDGYPGIYAIKAENVGNKTTSGEIVLEDVLPAGLTPTDVEFNYSGIGEVSENNDLHELLCPTLTECRFPGALEGLGIHGVKPHESLIMGVRAAPDPGLEAPLTDTARISGGGAAAAEASATNAASPEPPFGLLGLDTALTDSSKTTPYTQAGGHPYQFTTELNFETYSASHPNSKPLFFGHNTAPLGDPREISSELPPGLLANPQAVPRCRLADYYNSECSRASAVGRVDVLIEEQTKSVEFSEWEPLYNLDSSGSYPGQLGGLVRGSPFIMITAGLRSGSDYGVTATSLAPEAGLTRVRVDLWGVPAETAHDVERRGPAEVEETPFLTMPTECSGQPLNIVGRYNTWENPGEFAEAGDESPPVDGCNALGFEPSIEARPTTNIADASSGLEFKLHIPQNEDPEGLSAPSLQQAVVKLPAGLTINPSSGDGLAGCSEAQIGLHSEAPAACPDASKLGTVTVHTPLLHQPLEGSLYLATPHQNPFGSLLAGYISLEGEGVKVKLAGRFEADSQTGQITGRFAENPQVPFEDLELDLFGGAHGSLRTPLTCGSYKTTSVLTPYSHLEAGAEATPIAEPSAEFETIVGPGGEGAPCATDAAGAPNAPVFRAGTESAVAGAFTPFSLRLTRADGSQEFSRIETTLPPGLTGKLAGVAECSDAQLAVAQSRDHEGGGAEEKASPACPASSEVGEVEVASGAGPTPLYVKGHAYLAGPYQGAPLSLAIITPAVAGPFDLGDVAVRTALFVDPETARIKAVSDPIPHILQGIPLDVRTITLNMNRPNFTLNPTNCEELGFSGSVTSLLGNVAPLSQRFQVGGCQALPFKPKLSIRLKGGTKRSGTPALQAVLKMPPGNANVAFAQVTLPHSELLDQGHLENICTRVQFNEHACPANSIYGHAVAYSPLLDRPLEGPVYLRSSSHLLPDLAVDLEGQIQVVLDSKVDSVHESLRNTFEVVPDAPVSKFVLTMRGGKHSLIENSTDICLHKQRATGLFRGQNGKTIEVNPRLQVHCKGKGKHKHHGKKRHRRH